MIDSRPTQFNADLDTLVTNYDDLASLEYFPLTLLEIMILRNLKGYDCIIKAM